MQFHFRPIHAEGRAPIAPLALTVAGWQIYLRRMETLGALTPEIDKAYFSVGYLLQGIEIFVGGGYLYAAFPSAGTEIVVGGGVVESTTVDGVMIIMEASVHGAVSLPEPHAVLAFVEHGAATPAEA